MTELVFFLEEASARALLDGLLPRLFPSNMHVIPRFIVFEGKQDLERQLVKKLRGYLNPKARFIILRDQDNERCARIKNALVDLCLAAGRPEAIVRIACREIGAFYLGDLRAVELAFQLRNVATKQERARHRNPDKIHSPSRELEKLTGNKYQKVAGSRAIAPHLELESPRSRSFHHLLQAIRGANRTRRAGGSLPA